MKHYQASQSRPFALFTRERARGKVFYYRTFDDHGRPAGEWSTGLLDRRAAEAFCREAHNAGTLTQPGKKVQAPVLNFATYFSKWFVWEKDKEPECPYIRNRLARGLSYSPGNAYIQRRNLEKHILPAFGGRRIDRITTGEIEAWLRSLPAKSKISQVTANY